MPKFIVRKGHDAYVYYETAIEADSPESARELAQSIHFEGKWLATGEIAEYDHYDIDDDAGVRGMEDGETIEQYATVPVTESERDAILAGLRLLQIAVRTGDFPPMVRDIYTNDDTHPGLEAGAVDTLCERINV